MQNEEDFNTFLEQIFLKLEKERLKNNLSYQELAYKCDMDKSNIINIINNNKNMTLKTLYKICNGLEINVCDVFHKEDVEVI